MTDEQENNLLAAIVVGGCAAIIYNTMISITQGLIRTAAGGVNNPGNLTETPTKWEGETTKPGAKFSSFIDMMHGYRAMINNVRWHYKNGHITLNQLFKGTPTLGGYTSDPEPAPTIYAQNVAKALGIAVTDDYGKHIYNPDSSLKMLTAMTHQEQGSKFIVNPADINAAFASLEG